MTPAIWTAAKEVNSQDKFAIEELLAGSKLTQGFFVSWLFHTIVFGKITGGRLQLPPDVPDSALPQYIVRGNFFNLDQELYLYRTDKGMVKGRLREDSTRAFPGARTMPTKDVEEILIGRQENVASTEPWITIVSKSGSRFVVPREWGSDPKPTQRIFVLMRYYIDFSHHLAGFVDQRIVSIGQK